MFIIEIPDKERRKYIIQQLVNQFFHEEYPDIESALNQERFLFIERSTKTKTTKISIQDIQIFKQKLYFKSSQGEKLAIINNAQELTIEAQNSLLKILEEPPLETIILFLVSDKRRLLATILSRAVSLKENEISLIHKEFSEDKFTKIGYNVNTPESSSRVQQFLNLSLYEQLLFIAKNLQNQKETTPVLDKEDLVEVFIMDLLTYYESLLEKSCSQLLIQRIFLIEDCLKKVKKGVNSRLMLEYIILKLQTYNG